MPLYLILILSIYLFFQSFLKNDNPLSLSKSENIQASSVEKKNLSLQREGVSFECKTAEIKQTPPHRFISVSYKEKISVWNTKKRKFIPVSYKESHSIYLYKGHSDEKLKVGFTNGIGESERAF